MSVPEEPEIRISDADRDRAVERLNDAVAEGRLTMPEFEERVDGVLRARTGGEVAPYLADLPAVGHGGPEHGELRATMSSVKRQGRWYVPRRMSVQSKKGAVKLDLTAAVISHRVIEIEVDAVSGSTTLILPRGASVDVDPVEGSMVASAVSVRRVTRSPDPVGRPHVVVSGNLRKSSVIVRHQYRFLWWRW